ncbi:hypothetical protein CWI38_0979p0010 [Hamiltosporidium tvaerminnensis]|uniref:Uncharacterized protein n=1 Tax=Hamiltosporidium tvaerminnensis TaxID=1176355 RepID=A0A4Q9L4Y5_9MICR|nr:hypothetical protein LUQ84_3620 [Hamiltosporidium tvaerminnensis]TBU02623.1 hypothetical protein CWI37_0443p0020 [Hamiltosporidium tvaerminnensis]TBU11921.1 hypothetical protein CWI38_0979p0010 [Hamiltosporidium tvaerminnensis]
MKKNKRLVVLVLLGIIQSIFGIFCIYIFLKYQSLEGFEKKIIGELRKFSKLEEPKSLSSLFDIADLYFIDMMKKRLVLLTTNNLNDNYSTNQNDLTKILFFGFFPEKCLFNDFYKIENDKLRMFILEKYLEYTKIPSDFSKTFLFDRLIFRGVFLNMNIFHYNRFAPRFLFKLCEKFRNKKYIFDKYLDFIEYSILANESNSKIDEFQNLKFINIVSNIENISLCLFLEKSIVFYFLKFELRDENRYFIKWEKNVIDYNFYSSNDIHSVAFLKLTFDLVTKLSTSK